MGGLGVRSLFARLPSLLLLLLTFTYNGPLHHYTLEPIEVLARHQSNPQRLATYIRRFKSQKVEELDFVKKAATLSAAVVIGVFSWSSVDNAFWLARLFWYGSLWLSIFALVSFSQQRMLDQIHEPHHTDDDDEHWKHLLRLFLRPQGDPTDAEQGGGTRLVPDRRLTWVWQNPMMLMSYSWALFLLGYGLYFLTPLLPQSALDSKSKVVSIASIAIGVLVYLNLHLGSVWSSKAILATRQGQGREVEMSASFASEMTMRRETEEKKECVVSEADISEESSSSQLSRST